MLCELSEDSHPYPNRVKLVGARGTACRELLLKQKFRQATCMIGEGRDKRARVMVEFRSRIAVGYGSDPLAQDVLPAPTLELTLTLALRVPRLRAVGIMPTLALSQTST